MIVQERISEFKDDIIRDSLDHEEIFQKYIIDGNSYFFSEILKEKRKEYKTKTIISDFLGIHLNEIVFVGSAKLGFSLKPTNLFAEFDKKFNATKVNKDKSDIDIAIVSPLLFESISKGIFEYTDSFRKIWTETPYYSAESMKKFNVPIHYKYYEYFAKGWFRPDFKPEGYDFCRKGNYEALKSTLYRQHERKVGIGIYKDWYFFKNYHINNINIVSFDIKSNMV